MSTITFEGSMEGSMIVTTIWGPWSEPYLRDMQGSSFTFDSNSDPAVAIANRRRKTLRVYRQHYSRSQSVNLSLQPSLLVRPRSGRSASRGTLSSRMCDLPGSRRWLRSAHTGTSRSATSPRKSVRSSRPSGPVTPLSSRACSHHRDPIQLKCCKIILLCLIS